MGLFSQCQFNTALKSKMTKCLYIFDKVLSFLLPLSPIRSKNVRGQCFLRHDSIFVQKFFKDLIELSEELE